MADHVDHTADNIWLRFLEEEGPGQKSAFFSRQNQFAKTPGQTRAFGSLFDDALNEYLGRIGSAIRRGEAPTLTFNQDLDNNFDLARRLRRATPLYSTPQGISRPRVRTQFSPAFR